MTHRLKPKMALRRLPQTPIMPRTITMLRPHLKRKFPQVWNSAGPQMDTITIIITRVIFRHIRLRQRVIPTITILPLHILLPLTINPSFILQIHLIIKVLRDFVNYLNNLGVSQFFRWSQFVPTLILVQLVVCFNQMKSFNFLNIVPTFLALFVSLANFHNPFMYANPFLIINYGQIIGANLN